MRGNGKIIQELESFFRGAGWNVIKVVWGREWDALLHADRDGALVNLMNTTPDGDYQTYKANDGGYVRDHFFGRDPRTKALVQNMSDQEIWNLKRGGHDYRKVYAAYRAALDHKGQPTVILAKTIKGYSLGAHFQGRNATHQMKKLALEDLKYFRDAIRIPISDAQLEEDPYLPPYYHPGPDAPEIRYMLDRRRTLGGFLPERRTKTRALRLPGRDTYAALKKGSGQQEVATTMALVRTFKEVMRDAGDDGIGRRIVPIIPDEARTFGMDSWFPSLKIYNRNGQLYTAVDADLMLAYKESEIGQILHEGINEAGSVGSFIAAGTSYATHDEPMIPLYICYSMFGFQRTGDGLWAAADQMTRGFLLGATAGRTTLTGEGLQHADGHSLLLAATNPAAVSYDPAFAYEIAHIVESGLARMFGPDPENVYFYITVYNEPYVQPPEPDNFDPEGLLRGIYRYHTATEQRANTAQILASGVADAVGAEGRRDAGRRVGRGRRRVVGDQLGRVEPRRRGRPAGAAPPPGPAGRRPVRDPGPVEGGRPRDRGVGLDARGARADPAVGAGHLRHAGHRRVRLLRHPACGAALLQHRRRVAGGRRAGGAGARRGDRPVGAGRGRPPVPDRRRAGRPGADVRPRRGLSAPRRATRRRERAACRAFGGERAAGRTLDGRSVRRPLDAGAALAETS